MRAIARPGASCRDGGVAKPALVHVERLLVLLTKLELLRELPCNHGHLVGGERLGKLERLLPVQQVASHLKRRKRARRLQKVVLRDSMVVEHDREVAREKVLVFEALELLQGHDHACIAKVAVAAGGHRQVD